MAGKMMEGKEFDLEDFLEQMLQVKKMGSLTSLLGMLPGMGPDEGRPGARSTTRTSTGSPRSSAR
jgi:signal recognition particle GTPase